MNEILTNIKMNISKPYLFVGVIHFILTFFNDPIVFFRHDYFLSNVYYIAKFALFLVLILFWQLVSLTVKKIKNKDKQTIVFMKYFGLYFLIMLVLLLLTWPGVWRADDFSTYYFARELKIDFWQHWLMSLFEMVTLLIIPFPVAIVLNQLFIISLTVGYIVAQFHFNVSSKYAPMLFIPFLLPSILVNNLCPIKIILFAYFELLLLSLLIFKYLDSSKIKKTDIVVYAVLTSLISTLRPEAGFFTLGIPILIAVLFIDRLKIKQFISLLLLISIFTIPILNIQNNGLGDKKYLITGFVDPLANIVKTDFKSNNKQKDIRIINNVIDIDALRTMSGTKAFDSKVALRHTDKKSVYTLLFTYLKLVYYNFPVFVKERAISFSNAIYNVVTDNPDSFKSRMYSEKDFMNKPFNKDFRFRVVKFLECKKQSDYYKPNFLFHVFYNPVLNLLLLVCMFVFGLIKRNRLIICIPLIVIVQNLITIAVMVAQTFLYYFAPVICSYVFLMMLILYRRSLKLKS